MKYTIGNIVTFTTTTRPRGVILGYIDEIMICDGIYAYWITYSSNEYDRVFRFQDEIKLATDTQVVEELSDMLKLYLVTNYAETI